MSYATVTELREYLDQLPSYGRQRIAVTGTPTGGSYTLLYEGVASAAIAYNATATAVQTAIRGIVAIGSSGVKVTGAPGNYLAEFQGVLATDAGPLTLGTNSLTGGVSPSISIMIAADALFQKVLDRASRMIDTYLGTSMEAPVSGTRVVYGDGTDYLALPPFVAGSVSAVTAPSGYTVPDYIEVDGHLVVARSGRINASPNRYYGDYGYGYYDFFDYPYTGWWAGLPYSVTATFGAVPPADIVEACLEIAVDLWRFKDSGSIKTVGVEGAGMVSGKGLPATAKMILDAHMARVGVY